MYESRASVARRRLRRGEAALGGECGDVEVDPPERGRERDAEKGARDRRPRDRVPEAPTPIETIDSPSAMITISAVALGEVRGRVQAPAGGADHLGADVVDGDGGDPERKLRLAAGSGTDEHRDDRHGGDEPEAPELLHEAGVGGAAGATA